MADRLGMFRKLVLPILGTLWGLSIVVSGLVQGFGEGAFGNGQRVAFAFGVVMLASGAWALARYARARA